MSLNIVEAALASKLKGDQGQQLPEVTSADNGKALVVQNGEWTAAEVQSANLGTLTATSNETYYASDDGYDGYSEVEVDVPTSATLVPLNVHQNGYYLPSEYFADGFSEVIVDVPTEGNPNRYFMFTGTVDDPTGGAVSDYSQVIQGVNSIAMTVFMQVDENTTLGTPALTLTSVMYFSSQLSLIQGTLDSQLSSCNVAQVVYDANGLVSVITIQNGTVVDLTPYASMLTCTMTVFVHPVPD